MGNDKARTPSLGAVLSQAIEARLADVNTCLPGRVEAYDASSDTVSVQPLIRRKWRHKAAPTALPVVSGVPVHRPRSSDSWLALPDPVKGDLVLLVFAQRALEPWHGKGGLCDPVDSRRFDLSDAIAIPGLYDRTRVIARKGARTSVELANGQGWVEVTRTGGLRLNRGGLELLDVLKGLCDALSSAQALDPVSGPIPLTPGTIAAIEAVKSKIETLRG